MLRSLYTVALCTATCSFLSHRPINILWNDMNACHKIRCMYSVWTKLKANYSLIVNTHALPGAHIVEHVEPAFLQHSAAVIPTKAFSCSKKEIATTIEIIMYGTPAIIGEIVQLAPLQYWAPVLSTNTQKTMPIWDHIFNHLHCKLYGLPHKCTYCAKQAIPPD